jgi:parallel beta-helix repeat protein
MFLGHGQSGVVGEGYPVIALHECTGNLIIEGNGFLLHKGGIVRAVGGDPVTVRDNTWWSASVDHGLECVSFQCGHPWTRRGSCLAYGHAWDEVGDPFQGAKGGTNNRRGYANSAQRRWIQLPTSGNRTYIDISAIDQIGYLSPPAGHEWFLKWQGGPNGVRGQYQQGDSTAGVLVVDWFHADGSPCSFAGQAALWYAIDFSWMHSGGVIEGNIGGGHPGQLGQGGSRSGGASVACYVHRDTVARRNQFTNNLDAGIHFEYGMDSVIEDNDLSGNQGGAGNQYEFVFFSKGCIARNNRLGAGRGSIVHQGCSSIRTILLDRPANLDVFPETTTSDTGFALARRFTHVEDVRVGNPKVENPSMTSLSQAFYGSLLSPSDVSVIDPD